MAQPGDVLHHPVTGESMVIRETAETTKGEAFAAEVSVRPHGFVAAAHVHPNQEERFQVMAGTISFLVDGREFTLTAGQRTVVPAGVPHLWWNGGDNEVRVLVEVLPALRTEQFFENFFGLGRDGKTNPRTGLPGLLQLAVIANHFRNEVYLAQPPYWVQRVVFGLLARVGRLRGYRAVYQQYSGQGRDHTRLAA